MTTRTHPPGMDPTNVHWQHRDSLPMWTIYCRPADYPQGYVARMFLAIGQPDGEPSPTQYAIYADTLEALREVMPRGTFALMRAPTDHPTAVETWL